MITKFKKLFSKKEDYKIGTLSKLKNVKCSICKKKKPFVLYFELNDKSFKIQGCTDCFTIFLKAFPDGKYEIKTDKFKCVFDIISLLMKESEKI